MTFEWKGISLFIRKCILILFIHLTLIACGSDEFVTYTAEGYQIAPSLLPSPSPSPSPVSVYPTQSVQKYITVDQFGYRSGDKKIAVIKNPQVGLDSAVHFTPSVTIQLRKVEGDLAVANLSPVAWNSGATHVQSGDKGWWLDFSSVTTPGTYYLLDVIQNVRSPIFKIEDNVYKEILKTAVRTYFYERSGFAKATPFAESCWTDSAAYLKPDQDSQAEDLRHYKTPGSFPSLKRDLSGGWFDAGDMNKYTTFAAKPVSSLLTAYTENPTVFTDDFNIPESGNGIPDVLDEVMYELEWVKKMQNADGSLALKVGKIYETPVVASSAPPSKDTDIKYYIGECTSSTIAGASMFSHAAYVFRNIPALQVEATLLQSRAISAWNNYLIKYNANSLETNCDDTTIHAGDADIGTIDEQKAEAVIAAVYLFALTGDSAYENYISANYSRTRPFNDMGWSRYSHDQGDALLVYTQLSN